MLCWLFTSTGANVVNYLPLFVQTKLIIQAAYGSSRHLPVFRELMMQPEQIYIHMRKPKSQSKRPPQLQVQECQVRSKGPVNIV